ncbi:Stk1 family PASTA domain-containing Ser/Thr kinase [Halobacillus halophilus]|uniref:Stk1 family PASTA domain-containing Ser/Thr kinase n=1 Tax=Halobacillus halophilus TaxID=1570 RepID=UPI001CD63E57|nr:Stk1 family PASTA domain-containing Ser/Thr kinase [Halobacillus halophilus]MCA1009117.1 Stk1 family PASTA domain-containing Ser/Thr kinase [Halobacillus halophilus]
MLNDRLLNDRYQIQDMIGGGGMANVYLAHDVILDREVAIKILRLEHENDDEFIARFHREAQSATSLAHSNIVNIYDVGEEEDIYYMVMEYVDGMTLKQYIQKHSPIDVAEAVDIMRQVTSAISHAHDNEIIHRDIKPQNILIDHYGHVKVTDFGIAMALSATSLTQTNSVLGSVHYLSPEQARGGMATKKSDVYSLGIVFFELLTGRLPFSGESPVSIALKHLQHETPSLRRWINNLPQSVENIVLKATAKDPFHRYESVVEMEADLETSLEPDRVNEPAFETPDEEEDEKTKAIPVITADTYGAQEEENTIVHSQNGSPPPVRERKPSKDEAAQSPGHKKKKGARFWLIPILILLLSGMTALFLIPGIIQPANVEMADVSGMEYEEAYSELREMNLEVKRETEYSDEVSEGMVIHTDPEPGKIIKEESEVVVYASLGKEKAEFEDYTGQKYEKVEQELKDKGYETIIPFKESSQQPEGEITAQLSPQAGEEVIPDETRVIFRVSSGPPRVNLGVLEGMTEDEATKYLNERNLKVDVSENYSDQVPQGEVISQNPEAATQVKEGSTVSITISLGPKEEPPRTETIQIEVPFAPDTAQNSEQESTEESNEGQDPESGTGEDSGEGPEPSEDTQAPEQKVLIYIEDMDHRLSDVFKEETITEDTVFEIPLTIQPGTEASYKVQRGDEVIEEGSVPY